MNVEQWVTILENPDYAVSDLGRIRNNYTGRILAVVRTTDRYCYVAYKLNGRQIKRGLAKLVCEGFVLKPENFNTPIHLDGDPYNCRAVNLVWRPRWFAMKHKYQFHNGVERQHTMLIRDKQTGEVLEIWEAVTRYGLLYSDILNSINHNTYVFPSMQFFEWVI